MSGTAEDDPLVETDEMLVKAFTAGDEAAYRRLVERYSRRVYAICLRYFGNAADAEDAAQEAFLALYRRASTFAGTARFSTWMYRVTTNACNDLARKRARRPQASAHPLDDRLPDPEDLLGRRELGIELSAALAGLERDYREPIILHDIAGLPYADVATRLGLPVGTVKSRIHRGHAKLAAALAHLRASSSEPSGPIAPQT